MRALLFAAALCISSSTAADTIRAVKNRAIICKSPDVLAVLKMMAEGQSDAAMQFARRNRCWALAPGEKMVVLENVESFLRMDYLNQTSSPGWTHEMWFK